MKTRLLKIYLKFIRRKLFAKKDVAYMVPYPLVSLYSRIIRDGTRSYVHYCAKECWLEEKSLMDWQSGEYSNSRNEIREFKKKYEKYSRKFWTTKAIMERNLRGIDE